MTEPTDAMVDLLAYELGLLPAADPETVARAEQRARDLYLTHRPAHRPDICRCRLEAL